MSSYYVSYLNCTRFKIQNMFPKNIETSPPGMLRYLKKKYMMVLAQKKFSDFIKTP